MRPSGEHAGYVFDPWSCVRRFMLAWLPVASVLKMSHVAPSRPMKRIFCPSGSLHHTGAMLYVPRKLVRLPSTKICGLPPAFETYAS